MRTIAAAFRDHQTGILDRLDDARRLLNAPVTPPATSLDESRAGIGEAAASYQAFKHHDVYDPIVAGDGDDAAAAAALKADCIALSDDYRAYDAAARAGAAGGFDTYRLATLAVADQIRLALIREFELVQQLSVYRDYADRPATDHG